MPGLACSEPTAAAVPPGAISGIRRRPRIESCQRFTVSDAKSLLEPGIQVLTIADGTRLELRWHSVRGCWGGKEGRAFLLVCPACQRGARVLHRPPAEGWSCWRCRPVSVRSHRRSGTHQKGKPLEWQLEQIDQQQREAAQLFGLVHWPPLKLLWTGPDLWNEPRRDDARRLRSERQRALVQRIDALETIRLGLLVPGIAAAFERLDATVPEWPGLAQKVQLAREVVASTAWVMRRRSVDRRPYRGRKRGRNQQSAKTSLATQATNRNTL